MVVPAEILHVLHAQSLRTFLAQECERILVIDPQQLWFEDALQGAVLLLAEKKRHAEEQSRGVAIHQVTDDTFLHSDPGLLFDRAEYVSGDTITGKWMPALLTTRERTILKNALNLPFIHRFREIASVDVGIVTGANKFFLVPDRVVHENDLIEWAHPMFGRSEHVPGVLYDEATHAFNRTAGLPSNFLWFKGARRELMPPRAKAYLAAGERDGLHLRYKCRIREPWYVVPHVHASPVAMLKRSHSFPRLVLNEVGAYTTDTAYRVRPGPGITAVDLVAGFVNSLTALSAELEGRHYGGGVLELVPSEIEKVLIPKPATGRESLHLLDNLIRSGSEPAETLAIRDAAVLKPLGICEADCEELRSAWLRLKSRRQRNAAISPASRDDE
jgi:adenine-specific DNA methylase